VDCGGYVNTVSEHRNTVLSLPTENGFLHMARISAMSWDPNSLVLINFGDRVMSTYNEVLRQRVENSMLCLALISFVFPSYLSLISLTDVTKVRIVSH